jgi:branched-chain amino acid aminotransferase
LEDHLDRFFESAKSIGLKVPETRDRIRKKIKKALTESGKKEAFIRLTCVDKKIFVFVTERTHPPEIYQKGVALRTSAVRRNSSSAEYPEAKSTAFLNQVLAALEPSPPGNYETHFLSQQGYLTEAKIGNIFIVKNGVILTPPPYGLLNGVTRRFVIKCARFGKLFVEERPLMRADVFNADEAFLTNTSWEILPVRELDGRAIGKALPGPVTRKLQRLFRRGVKREISKERNVKN